MPYSRMLDSVTEKYKARFRAQPASVAYAPGRIEVLGNHTDYNDGFVFSAAIDAGTVFAAGPSETGECTLVAGNLDKTASFSVEDVRPRGENTWQNYVAGTFHGLFDGNPAAAGRGFNAVFEGDIPLGAGLSSSASLEMAAALALSGLYGIEKDRTSLARIGQKAEHDFAGCPCGLLDQASSLYGKAGALVKSDFRNCVFENVDLGGDAVFMMVKSTAAHALVDGAYASRRKSCEDAARHFASVLRHPVTHLRDVSSAEWILHGKGLDETTARRAAHPIGENERVLLGAKLLERGDLDGFGALMFDSHESSRRWFDNSCAELDTIVDIAASVPGVLGARLSGGGFGGSCCLLVRPERTGSIAKEIAAGYAAVYGKEPLCRVIVPSDGARLV